MRRTVVVKMKRRLMSRESELPEISEVCPWAGLLREIFDVIVEEVALCISNFRHCACFGM